MAPKFDPNEVKIVFLSCLGGKVGFRSRSQAYYAASNAVSYNMCRAASQQKWLRTSHLQLAVASLCTSWYKTYRVPKDLLRSFKIF